MQPMGHIDNIADTSTELIKMIINDDFDGFILILKMNPDFDVERIFTIESTDGHRENSSVIMFAIGFRRSGMVRWMFQHRKVNSVTVMTYLIRNGLMPLANDLIKTTPDYVCHDHVLLRMICQNWRNFDMVNAFIDHGLIDFNERHEGETIIEIIERTMDEYDSADKMKILKWMRECNMQKKDAP